MGWLQRPSRFGLFRPGVLGVEPYGEGRPPVDRGRLPERGHPGIVSPSRRRRVLGEPRVAYRDLDWWVGDHSCTKAG